MKSPPHGGLFCSRLQEIRKRLVEEHHRLFDEYAVTNAKFDALLKGLSKSG
jgi:hypothetical protein